MKLGTNKETIKQFANEHRRTARKTSDIKKGFYSIKLTYIRIQGDPINQSETCVPHWLVTGDQINFFRPFPPTRLWSFVFNFLSPQSAGDSYACIIHVSVIVFCFELEKVIK